MSNNKGDVQRLVIDTFSTDEAEIQCDEAAYHMSRAAHLDFSSDAIQLQFAALLKHLQLCTNCSAEFELLQSLASEDQGLAVEVPPLPNNGRFPQWELAKNALNIRFPGFSSTLGEALTRGEALGLEPTAVSLPNTNISLEIDVDISETNPTQRDLFITLFNDNPNAGSLEGSSLWLHQDINAPIIQEQTFDDLGDLSFRGLPPGSYALRLHISGQQYAISEINLP